MSDAVGLNADLSLDIARALASVDELEAALNRATSGIAVELDYLTSVESFSDAIASAVAGVPVSADTTEAEAAIGALADAPPVDVPVAADTAEAEQLILALGDQPPVDVPVTADTTEAQAAVESFGRDIPPLTIDVEADLASAKEQVADLGAEAGRSAEGVAGLEGSVAGLGAAAGVAEGSAKELVATVGELGGESTAAAAGGILGMAAATGAFFEEGLNAVSAGQRFDLVLGDMANRIKEIDVNGLTTNMEDLGIKFGSTGAEMENVNSKLFQMAVNSGATKDQAVLFTQQVETLSARAISLNPQLGSLADVTDSLGTKIGRGGRFAANYGLDLNAAEIAARALVDTQKSVTSELTFAEKAIAGAEIASEKYGSTVAGTVAEGSKNAAVQVSEMKAQFKEAIEAIGVPIVAPVLDIIREVEPDAVVVAEALGKLAKDALPAVAAALTVVGPPLQAIGYVLDQIPDGVIAGTAAFFGFRFAMEAVAQAAIADEVALTALSTAIPWLAALSALVVGVTTVMGDMNETLDNETTQAIDSTVKGFDDLSVSVGDTLEATVEAAAATDDFAQHLNDAQVSNEQLASSLIEGGDAFEQYKTKILEAAAANDAGFDAIVRLSGELDHLKTSTEDQAESTLNQAVASGKLSAADRDAAVAKAGLIDGHENYAGALDIVQPKIAAAEQATKDQEQADQDAADAAAEHAQVLEQLAVANVGVAMTLENVTTNTGDQTAALEGLAVALQNANLEGKDLDAVAQELGVSTNDLKGFLTDVTGQIDSFVSTALNGLPSVKTAIDDALDPKAHEDKPIVIDPVKLQGEIDDSITKITAFNMQIQSLIDQGYTNLAGIAAQRGPEFTDALIHAVDGTDMAGVLNMKFAALEQTTAAEGPRLHAAGEAITLGTGQIAADAVKAFGEKFLLGPPTVAGTNAADAEIDGWAHTVPGAMAAIGSQAEDGWAHAFGAVPTSTESTLGDTSGKITGAAEGLKTDASGTAEAGAAGFAMGIAGVPGSADEAMKAAGANINSMTSVLVTDAYTSGRLVGASFDDGLSDGIDRYVGEVSSSAAAAVNAAEAAARAAADSHSPSEVFAAIGEDLAAGLAAGMERGLPVVDRAATTIVDSTAAAAAAAAATIASQHEQAHDNMHELGFISDADFVTMLRSRLSHYAEFSNEWTAIVRQIEQISADGVAAADQVAHEHESIHDVMFREGELSTEAYLAMLRHRLAGTVQYSEEYDAIWQQIKRIQDQAAADAQRAVDEQNAATQAIADNVARQWDETHRAEEAAADLHLQVLRNQVRLGVSTGEELRAYLNDQLLNLTQFSDAWMRARDELIALNNPASVVGSPLAPVSTAAPTFAQQSSLNGISLVVQVDASQVADQSHATRIGHAVGDAASSRIMSLVRQA